jgi:hypothetical protein
MTAVRIEAGLQRATGAHGERLDSVAALLSHLHSVSTAHCEDLEPPRKKRKGDDSAVVELRPLDDRDTIVLARVELVLVSLSTCTLVATFGRGVISRPNLVPWEFWTPDYMTERIVMSMFWLTGILLSSKSALGFYSIHRVGS